MKFGYFDDQHKEYVITYTENTTSLDQLSGKPGIFLPHIQYLRRLYLLSGCQTPAPDSLPL